MGADRMTLMLVSHPDQSVTGSGVDSAAGAVTTFPVRGTVSGGTVLLLFNTITVDSGFSGRFVTAARIDGTLAIPGLSQDRTFERR